MSTMQNTNANEPGWKANPEEYDLVILGGGTGGTIAAWTFAGQGQRVAVIERKYVGGSCQNIACMPSKNIIHSAKVASYLRRSEEFGIAKRDFTVNMSVVRERKRNMVSGWNNVYLENYKKTGAEFILGSGRFIAPKTLEVTLPNGTTRRLRAVRAQLWNPYLALPKLGRSPTSRRSNLTKFQVISSCSAAATSVWSLPRPCAASAAKSR